MELYLHSNYNARSNPQVRYDEHGFGKTPLLADLARRIGDELAAALKPCCEQACIAGSLRRNKA